MNACRPDDGVLPVSCNTYVQLGSTRMRVDSNSSSFLAQVDAMYGSRCPSLDGFDTTESSFYAHIGDGICARHWLSKDGAVIYAATSRSELLGRLEWLVTGTAVAHLGDHVLIHAGAVAEGDRAILLPAASGSGKTTLVAALMLAGLDYLSDEVAVIEPGSRHLKPFSKPLCLREGAWYRLSADYAALPAVPACRAPEERVWYLPPGPGRSPFAQYRVGVITIPLYDPSGSTSLRSLSKGAALAELIQQTFNLSTHRYGAVEVLTKLVRESECCRLTVADLAQSVKLLRSLLH
ncbi:MAG: hypothetical protein M1396_01950 [Chloroflexi bacterium]|nr:hypothetical protein [Chloroflexota bacterium]